MWLRAVLVMISVNLKIRCTEGYVAAPTEKERLFRSSTGTSAGATSWNIQFRDRLHCRQSVRWGTWNIRWAKEEGKIYLNVSKDICGLPYMTWLFRYWWEAASSSYRRIGRIVNRMDQIFTKAELFEMLEGRTHGELEKSLTLQALLIDCSIEHPKVGPMIMNQSCYIETVSDATNDTR